MRSTKIGILLLPALVLAARSARGEDSGFALGRFEPAEAGGHWFGGETLDFRGNFRPAVGFALDYAHQPLVATDKNGDVAATIVEKQALAHLGASFVLQNRLRIGVDLPLQLQAKGNTTSLGADTVAAPASSFAVGDLRLGIDDRLYGRSDGPFTAAIGLRLHLPTGDRASYTSDGSVRVVPRFMVAGKSGSFEWTGRVDYHTRDVVAYGTTKIGSELGVVATAGVRGAEGKLLIGPEVFAATALADGAFANSSSPVEALLGAHYNLTPSWIIGAGAGGGITGGYGTPTYRGVLSVAWAPPPADTDGDGIYDDIDACVAVKGVESDSPCKNGCPLDQDGDGIIDAEDACLAVAGIKTTDAHTNGCPDKDADGIVDSADACPDVKGIASTDSKANGCPDKDGDGVIDSADACVDVKGVASADPKANGCPADKDGDGIPDAVDACADVKGVASADPKANGCPADKDADGIPDAADACPDVKGVQSADPKLNGCPSDPDRDKDGIANEQDACPDNAGPASPKPEKNGCPLVVLRGEKIEIHEQVQFKTGSSEILGASDELLTKVAAVFKEHAEITKVLVEGHTDNQGVAANNQKLSDARAASVRTWLTKHGVDGARLASKGFGQDKPIATNDTEEGRAKNRRVEFKILETGKPGAIAPAKASEPAKPAAPAKPRAPAKPAPKKK